MGRPRYDKSSDRSRHSAADDGCCEEMAEKYNWRLVGAEPSGDPILPVDCVFEGKTEFPKPYSETDKEEEE